MFFPCFQKTADILAVPFSSDCPLNEDVGPLNETKAQGGWYLQSNILAVEPLDHRVPGIDYQVVGKDFDEGDVQDSEAIPPTADADKWESRRPANPRRLFMNRWSDHETENLILLMFISKCKTGREWPHWLNVLSTNVKKNGANLQAYPWMTGLHQTGRKNRRQSWQDSLMSMA